MQIGRGFFYLNVFDKPYRVREHSYDNPKVTRTRKADMLEHLTLTQLDLIARKLNMKPAELATVLFSEIQQLPQREL